MLARMARALDTVRQDAPDVLVLDLMMRTLKSWGFIDQASKLSRGTTMQCLSATINRVAEQLQAAWPSPLIWTSS